VLDAARRLHERTLRAGGDDGSDGGSRRTGDPTPGQQTIDGGEVQSVYVEQIRVDGTTQVAIDFGGKQAQTARLTLSGSVEVDGFFRKGDRIRGTFEAVVVSVGAKDTLDKQTGIVTEAVQTHTARVVDLVVE
jgi:hypothetical protein